MQPSWNRRRLLAAGLIGLALPGTVLTTAATAAEGGEKKKGGGDSYIQFPTLTATIIRATGHRGVLTVESGLDVPDPKLFLLASQSGPRLRDAYVRFLEIYAAGLGPAGLPDAEVISVSLQRATDQVLGRAGAHLLLGTIIAN